MQAQAGIVALGAVSLASVAGVDIVRSLLIGAGSAVVALLRPVAVEWAKGHSARATERRADRRAAWQEEQERAWSVREMAAVDQLPSPEAKLQALREIRAAARKEPTDP
jgi:hypothetical protein